MVRHGRVADPGRRAPRAGRRAGVHRAAGVARRTEHGEYPFDAEPGTDEGWAKETRGYWLRDWPGYLEFFFATCFTEPHSTKQIEDCVGWAGDTDMETILAGFRGWETKIIDPAEVAALCPRVRCPVLVIHGTEDAQVDAWRWGRTWPASSVAGWSCSRGPGTRPTPATR